MMKKLKVFFKESSLEISARLLWEIRRKISEWKSLDCGECSKDIAGGILEYSIFF